MSTTPSQFDPDIGIGVPVDEAIDPTAPQIKARGYWEQVWIRFRRDKVALASIFFIVFLIFAAFPGAYIAEKLLGHGPNQLFFDGVDERLVPVGPWSYVTNPETGEKELLILGADGSLGRDEFLRLLYGGRVSLEVAMLSTFGRRRIMSRRMRYDSDGVSRRRSVRRRMGSLRGCTRSGSSRRETGALHRARGAMNTCCSSTEKESYAGGNIVLAFMEAS